MNPSYSEQSSANASIAIALSGGPDSVALLLHATQTFDHKLITAIHINHGLRGSESDQDEIFCRELCNSLGIRFHCEKLSQSARDEASLRNERYARIAAFCNEHGIQFVFTAHTLDDQVETLLFRLFRGTSPAGLVGIPYERPLSNRVTVQRPLLNTRRAEVMRFLEESKAQFRTDSSNLSNDYSRNYIRNAILPLVTERFGDVIPRIENFRIQLESEQAFLSELAEAKSTTESAFLSLAEPLQRRIIAQHLRAHGVEVSLERVTSIIDTIARGGSMTLSSSVELRAKDGSFSFESPDKEVLADDTSTKLFSGLNILPHAGIAITIKPVKSRPAKFPLAAADEAFVDLSRLPHPVSLFARRRRSGDVITPFGMTQQVKLKRYLQTHRDANGNHSGFPIVLASEREVLWVPGVGISEKIRVHENPTHHLQRIVLSPDDNPIC